MQLFVCCVRDRAADAFGPPYCSPAMGLAQRGFRDQINRADESNPLFKHPEDFDLYCLGLYDDSTAEFTLYEKPRQVAIGKDLVGVSKP